MSSNILSDLTCSQCQKLYENPKILPNCSHSFCLSCIKKFKRVGATLACPDCKTISSIPFKGGVDAFITNVVVQNIVSKMKQIKPGAKSSEVLDADADSCQHAAEMRESCDHCCESFCRTCSYRHMEKIKEQIANLIAGNEKIPKSEFGAKAEEMISKFESLFAIDLQTIDVQLDNAIQALIRVFTDILLDRVSVLKNQARELVSGEIGKLRALLDENSKLFPVSDAKENFLRLTATSVFKQKLQDFTSLYSVISKATNREANFDHLSNLLNNSSHLLSFAAGDFSILESAMLNLHLGSFEIQTQSLTAIDSHGSLHSPVESSSPLSNDENTIITDTPSPKPEMIAKIVEQPVKTFVHCILALPTQQQFAVLSTSEGVNRIELFDVHGESVKQFVIFKPDRSIASFTIDHMATDFQNTIFATTTLRCEAGVKQRAIYRFWLNKIKDGGVEPVLFTKGRDRLSHAFKGIAISRQLRLVFTTETYYIVAYESVYLAIHEKGRQIARWNAGPGPLLHSVFDCFNDGIYSLVMICHINDGTKLLHWTGHPTNLNTGRPDPECLTKTLKRGFYLEEIRTKAVADASAICFYQEGSKALAFSGGKIYNFTSLKPKVVFNSPTLLKGDGDNVSALSVLTTGKCHSVALVHHTDKMKGFKITFTDLIDDS